MSCSSELNVADLSQYIYVHIFKLIIELNHYVTLYKLKAFQQN